MEPVHGDDLPWSFLDSPGIRQPSTRERITMTAAILCSFIATCDRRKVNVFESLRDVLTRIAAHLGSPDAYEG